MFWLKTRTTDYTVSKAYATAIYAQDTKRTRKIFTQHQITFTPCTRKDYFGNNKKVLKLPVPTLDQFERFIQYIERITRFRVPLYDCDVKPEQQYLFSQNIIPCSGVKTKKGDFISETRESSPLRCVDIHISLTGDYRTSNKPLDSVSIDGRTLEGSEYEQLVTFASLFASLNPDVIFMKYGYRRLPYLAKRLRAHGLYVPFHRFDPKPLKYRGGRPFWTYGMVMYRDYSFKLNGRFLIDTATTVGSTGDIRAIMELVSLCGMRVQDVVARSSGAVFQSNLLRLMYQDRFLIPYKEKPLEEPLSLYELLDGDRAGHTFDPQLGFHRDVAEIDFSSMYPHIIYLKNISAETILGKKEQYEQVPGIHVKISTKKKGLAARAIKEFIDKRMEHKKNPTALNKIKSRGLKGVLVSSYGYLRFREFKLGIPSGHMSICAYAREILVECMQMAEQRGFEVVHGIIDSLYIKKKGLTKQEVDDFCTALHKKFSIPVESDHIFSWIMFLPRISDRDIPVPARYYGVDKEGTIKTRGIEQRKRSTPKLIKYFQEKIIEDMSDFHTSKEIRNRLPYYVMQIKHILKQLPTFSPDWLSVLVRISKTDYKHNIAQKKIVQKLTKRNIALDPGEYIEYVHTTSGPELLSVYTYNPDTQTYKKMLIKALYELLQPLDIEKETIESLLAGQLRIQDVWTVSTRYTEGRNRETIWATTDKL